MNIRFFGHAALKVAVANAPGVKSTLFDPWFSRRGAFFGSWYQFPENYPLLDEALRDVTHICVSHNHADHIDPDVLLPALAADPERRVHIAKFTTPWFFERAKRMLGRFADRVIEHRPFEPFEAAPGIKVFFVPEESPAQIDSAIVAYDEHRALINLNDSRLTTHQLHEIRDRVPKSVVVALQASGASEYPICYGYPPVEMRARSAEKRRIKFAHAQKLLEDLDPERVLFFAGPPVFLDPELTRFNDTSADSVFPDQLDVVRHYEKAAPKIADKCYFVVPGDHLDDRHLWRSTDLANPRYRAFTQKAAYVEEYARSREDLLRFDRGAMPPRTELLEHFKKMAACSDYAAKKIDGEVTFIILARDDEAAFTVDFKTKSARPGRSAEPLYILTAPASSVADVLKDLATWDDVMLSVRMTWDERTDRFVQHLKTLLKYMDRTLLENVARYEESMQDPASRLPTMDVTLDDGTWRIQRICPHSGADLLVHGQVDPSGTVTCMAHRFIFDVRSGRCRNAAGWKLKTTKLS